MYPGSFATNTSVLLSDALTAIAQRSLNGYATESTKCDKFTPRACGFIFIFVILEDVSDSVNLNEV